MISNKMMLIAEDDPAQAKLYLLAVKETYPNQLMTFFEDGKKLIDYVENLSGSLPGLIILDSKLPLISGTEAAFRIKSNPALKHIPVVIFSASEHPDFYRECYEAGVNSCLLKPALFTDITEMLKVTIEFWMHTNRLPV